MTVQGLELLGLDVAVVRRDVELPEGRMLAVDVVSRAYGAAGARLLTVAVTNRTSPEVRGSMSARTVFQAGFVARIVRGEDVSNILPYPSADPDLIASEVDTMELLYRNQRTFAAGHGTSASWESESDSDRARAVMAEPLPVVEVPSITPDVTREDGTPLRVQMAELAGLAGDDFGIAALEELVDRYEAWIEQQTGNAHNFSDRLQRPARQHLDACRSAASSMRHGISILSQDEIVHEAFQLANHSVLLQQIQSTGEIRTLVPTPRSYSFDRPHSEPDPLRPPEGRGSWRPFQIAFLLAAIASTANGQDLERELVELIWFPTGGGKTEAYLGLIAFSIFLRRLRDPSDTGVQAIMRYTLRLLTTQQFQRAARLFCAMEVLRQDHESQLGNAPFRVGIWLGRKMTPNTRTEANTIIRQLSRGDNVSNKFLLTQCPWCRAQMGPLADDNLPHLLGYERRGNSVALVCPDPECSFSQDRCLPVLLIDEDIYEQRPDLIIGTVDKFAMLAWRPDARGIFGFCREGHRICSPPELIIQDELHLITGPLGSIAGLYETVIEDLCTDHRGSGSSIKPKIVCSTATIRTHSEQILALYGRQQSRLFPPPGLSVSDSFFAQHARDEAGVLRPGRVFVGVHAPGLSSALDAQARVIAALLQAPEPFETEERDPWWTNLVFFNSLRELGTSLSQLSSYIPGYLREMAKRSAWSGRPRPRYPYRVLELTGRLEDDHVSRALEHLERSTGSTEGSPIDVCLASSIIEVGVDIERLSLMTVISQPKMSSQYIQVTGRIGRRWWERPGLVAIVFSVGRPRDRSHFERFRSYHERVYANVEPTSVTPFAEPVLERCLPGVIASYVRQTVPWEAAHRATPMPADRLEELHELLRNRVRLVDDREQVTLDRVFLRHRAEWSRREPAMWTAARRADEDPPLIYAAEDYVPAHWREVSWKAPRSMRNVDVQCRAIVTQKYITEPGLPDD